MTAPSFARDLLGWKPSTKNKAQWAWVPNVADVDNLESLTLSAAMLTALGIPNPNVGGQPTSAPPSSPGVHLENGVRDDLAARLPLVPTRAWDVRRGALITDYVQYEHLVAIDQLIQHDPNLRVTLGRDYLIRPDVVVGLLATPTGASSAPWMHAAVSCKWSIRSDRVQNIRHEFGQLIRHRRGRLPHLVTVTAEPLPTRLASIARGTGEVDATYHIAFDELEQAVAASSNVGQQGAWAEVVGQGRLRDYNQLVAALIHW